MTLETPRLLLLSRENCHLCEVAARDLDRLGAPFDIVDIDRDPALRELYNEAIPVLLHGERELARAPLTPDAIESALEQARIRTPPRSR
jgi:hypothetical protein